MFLQVFMAVIVTGLSGLHDPTSIAVLSTGHQFTEGPVWHPDGTLLFTDIPADRIHRGAGPVFREPSGQANGLTLDRTGRLIAAEHAERRVTRTEQDGQITVLADRFEGKRFNSPNDVVVGRDGAVYFTDPPYGLAGGMANSELGFSGVYAVVPETGTVTLVGKDFNKPNGLCFSPDESKLYVADSEGEHGAPGKGGDIWVFTKIGKGGFDRGKLFCPAPVPDGIKADVLGQLWVTCREGVRVYSPEGTLLETVILPEEPANCGFGGEDGKTLYVTARTSVYMVKTAVAGIFPAGQK